MKAVVLDSKEGRSVVLADDGRILEVKGWYQAGEIIELKKKHRNFAWRQIAAVGTAACLLLGVGFYGYQTRRQNTVYAAVRFTSGPAIEYTLDQRNQVIAVTALKQEASALADEVLRRTSGKSFEETLDVTLGLLEEGAVQVGEGALETEVISSDESRKTELEHTVERVRKKHKPRRKKKPAAEMAANETATEEVTEKGGDDADLAGFERPVQPETNEAVQPENLPEAGKENPPEILPAEDDQDFAPDVKTGDLPTGDMEKPIERPEGEAPARDPAGMPAEDGFPDRKGPEGNPGGSEQPRMQ